MKPKTCLTLIFLLMLAAGLTGLVSCGGGGGGGGGLAYTGSVDQAQITGDNALELAVGTWNTANTGTNVDILGAVQTTTGFESGPSSLMGMSLIFEDVVRNMNIASMSGEANLGAVQSVNEEITGACNDDNTIAGRAAVSGSLDDVSGVFTLTANFNNYCEYEQGVGVTINGVAILSGTLDPATLDNDFPDFFNYTFTFTTLSLDYLGTDEGITMNGTFGANWVSSPMLVTMSFILKDNASLATYWFKDVRISLAEGVGYTDITNMTGRYYEPVYGYVDISIDNPIHMNDIDNWPSSGSFIVTGTENSKARLTYVNATQFQVVADTDGDGLYDDYSSGNLLWADY